MRRFRLGLLCAAAFAAGPALAADYDPPVVVDEAPDYAPVEVGSGWYLRGDVAYTVAGGYGDDQDYVGYEWALTPYDPFDAEEHVFSGSVGAGYHFNDIFRADVNVGYIPGDRFSVGYNDLTMSAASDYRNDAIYGLANLYADLGTFAGFTPYVGAGVGVLSSRWQASGYLTDVSGTVAAQDDRRDYALAYSLNAGFAYNLGNNVSVDLGYQFVSAPEAEAITAYDYTDFRAEKGLDFHQIKLGLRYDLW